MYILNLVYMDLIYILQGKCQRLKICVILCFYWTFKKPIWIELLVHVLEDKMGNNNIF